MLSLKDSLYIRNQKGFTYLDRLSFNSYNDGEDLRAQALPY